MAVEDVVHAIRQVQPHLSEYQTVQHRGPVNDGAPANNDEMSTRYLIIDPLLRSLGWDLSDPTHCVVEYRTQGRSGRGSWTMRSLTLVVIPPCWSRRSVSGFLPAMFPALNTRMIDGGNGQSGLRGCATIWTMLAPLRPGCSVG